MYFSPRFGGAPDEWKEANTYAFTALMKNYNDYSTNNPYIEYADYKKKERDQWILDTFKAMKMEVPDLGTRLKLAKEATHWIIQRIQSSYPGVIKTVEFLAKKGFTLCTASGEASDELNGYLTGMGIQNYFSKLYGPDLINTLKASKRFYDEIFLDLEIEATQAIVVDDSPKAISWAATTGATTIHVLHSGKCISKYCNYHISSLEDIQQILG
jgi:HAD superfamily hydrolase (TIGR01509 family)